MNKRIAILDIVCYVAVPLLVWNLLRDSLGDYYAMLLTTVPGIVYSVYRFKELKKVNFSGLFLLGNVVATALISVLAGSALQMLWNNVWYLLFLGVLFFGSILIKRPLFLYFALDIVELQGYDRDNAKAFFLTKRVFQVFILITLLFALRDVGLAGIKAWLIGQYGVNAFDKAILLRQGLNWGTTILAAFGLAYVVKMSEGSNVFEKPEQA